MLTVNQVVDILLAWSDKRDWGAAFQSVIPGRKQTVAAADGPVAKDDAAPAEAPEVKAAADGAAGDGNNESSADAACGRASSAAVEGNAGVAVNEPVGVEGSAEHDDGDRKRALVPSSEDDIAVIGESKRQKQEPHADVLS